eukprot:scaffold336_cov250-Pinguiococcus_pyrenoidosus.AAC.38
MLRAHGTFYAYHGFQGERVRGVAHAAHLQVRLAVQALRLDVADALWRRGVGLVGTEQQNVRRHDLAVVHDHNVPHGNVRPCHRAAKAVPDDRGLARVGLGVRLVLGDVLRESTSAKRRGARKTGRKEH